MIPAISPTSTFESIALWADYMASSLWNVGYIIIGIMVGALILAWIVSVIHYYFFGGKTLFGFSSDKVNRFNDKD